MANEIQFMAMLTVNKNGAQVSFPNNTKALNMAGNNMVQQPQLIPTAGVQLNLGLISSAPPAKLMIKNNSYGFGISAVAIAAAGTGYTVGDVLTIPGGASGSGNLNSATATVSSISGGGGTGPITGLTISGYGDYSSVPASTVAPTGGTGNGASLTLTFAANNVIVYGNSGFTQPQDTLQAGDFILRSPSSSNLYLKPTNGPVYVLTVGSEP